MNELERQEQLSIISKQVKEIEDASKQSLIDLVTLLKKRGVSIPEHWSMNETPPI